MGWGDVISIGLGLGNLAVNANNASQLQQMKMQQASEALIREFFNALRTGMFNLNQTAEDVLRSEASAPLKAAGAMRILDYQLTASGVTPDVFTDLGDKKFAADTGRMIRENSGRMYAALDTVGQSQVDQLVEHVRRLADYHYYLENFHSAQRLQEAQAILAQNPNRAGGCLIGFEVYMLIGLGLTGLMLLASSPGLGLLLIAGAVGGAVYVGKQRKNSQATKEAQKVVKELEGTLDLNRFLELDGQFKTEDVARAEQQQAEQYVEGFFGDYGLLQDGWRS